MANSPVVVPVDSINRLREAFPGKEICFEAEFSVREFWTGMRAILDELQAIDVVPISVKCSSNGSVHCSMIDRGKDLQRFAHNIASQDDLEVVRWTTRLNM